MITQEEARARVAKGAALLDERRPGWYTSINLDKFYMQSCYSCALGQVFGDYWLGVQQLWAPEMTVDDISTYSQANLLATAHGFFTRSPVHITNDFDVYKSLKEAWVDAIITRLAAVQLQLEEVHV